MSTVISFGAEGTATAMHKDEFPLGFLGKQSISRASEIIFNEDTQLWDIHLPIGKEGDISWARFGVCAGFNGYDLARKIEVDWFEQSRLHSVHPLSTEGITFLNSAKEKFNA